MALTCADCFGSGGRAGRIATLSTVVVRSYGHAMGTGREDRWAEAYRDGYCLGLGSVGRPVGERLRVCTGLGRRRSGAARPMAETSSERCSPLVVCRQREQVRRGVPGEPLRLAVVDVDGLAGNGGLVSGHADLLGQRQDGVLGRAHELNADLLHLTKQQAADPVTGLQQGHRLARRDEFPRRQDMGAHPRRHRQQRAGHDRLVPLASEDHPPAPRLTPQIRRQGVSTAPTSLAIALPGRRRPSTANSSASRRTGSTTPGRMRHPRQVPCESGPFAHGQGVLAKSQQEDDGSRRAAARATRSGGPDEACAIHGTPRPASGSPVAS
jgi:hypothetical protein